MGLLLEKPAFPLLAFPAPSSTVSLLPQLPLAISHHAPPPQSAQPPHMPTCTLGSFLEARPRLSSSATQSNLTRLCFLSWGFKFQRKKKKWRTCSFNWLLGSDGQDGEVSWGEGMVGNSNPLLWLESASQGIWTGQRAGVRRKPGGQQVQPKRPLKATRSTSAPNQSTQWPGIFPVP